MCELMEQGFHCLCYSVVAVDSKGDRPAEDTELSGCEPQPRDQTPA